MTRNAATEPEAFRIDAEMADNLICEAMPRYAEEQVALAESAGLVLRQDVVAERDQPPFDRATMDGIAIAGESLTTSDRSYRITGTQAAGHATQPLTGPADCLEIMTGAVMPPGADTVIPVERLAIDADTATIEEGYTAEPGQFVHRRASDHAKGETLLQPGAIIGGPEMAILTAAGQSQVSVGCCPRIAIVSTGDELVDVGAPIKDFQIRSSNDRAIETHLHLHGLQRTIRSHLPDDPAQLRDTIRQLHDSNDVLILSGGVSMGKYDYIPGILEELGVQVRFHKILQRPGLPMWFGVSQANKPVFALPGNPVSTIVCCVRYVVPALFTALGATQWQPDAVRLAEDVHFEPDLTWFLPVQLQRDPEAGMVAVPRPTNTSGDFIGLRNTDGFIELPRGRSIYPKGIAANLYRW